MDNYRLFLRVARENDPESLSDDPYVAAASSLGADDPGLGGLDERIDAAIRLADDWSRSLEAALAFLQLLRTVSSGKSARLLCLEHEADALLARLARVFPGGGFEVCHVCPDVSFGCGAAPGWVLTAGLGEWLKASRAVVVSDLAWDEYGYLLALLPDTGKLTRLADLLM